MSLDKHRAAARELGLEAEQPMLVAGELTVGGTCETLATLNPMTGHELAQGRGEIVCVFATSDSRGYVKFAQRMRPWHQYEHPAMEEGTP
jgi:hypothetical protein